MTDDVITAYIADQTQDDDGDFRVEGEEAQKGGPPKPSA